MFLCSIFEWMTVFFKKWRKLHYLSLESIWTKLDRRRIFWVSIAGSTINSKIWDAMHKKDLIFLQYLEISLSLTLSVLHWCVELWFNGRKMLLFLAISRIDNTVYDWDAEYSYLCCVIEFVHTTKTFSTTRKLVGSESFEMKKDTSVVMVYFLLIKSSV